MKLIDQRTRDGSRHFATLPQAVAWQRVCDHVASLPGVEMIRGVTDWPGRLWLDFQFHGHRFAINARDGVFRLLVRDPQCPDLLLYQVGCHFQCLIEGVEKAEMPRLDPIAEDEVA